MNEAELYRRDGDHLIRGGALDNVREELLRLAKTKPNGYYMVWQGKRYEAFQAERLKF